MDMRKLIDETDFDNLNQLSKRWKKDANPSLTESQYSQPPEKGNNFEKTKNHFKETTFKENISEQSNTQRPTLQAYSMEMPKKKREVLPQIIDQDTEHFRNRLENLLNIFKTDAVTEFMSMKRSMLDYQKETIKSDTQKYLSMSEEKHQQLLQTKQKLISLTSDVERKGMQIQLMSGHIAKLNQKIRITKCLSRPFSILYENKVQEKMMKFKFVQAAKFNEKRLKNKSLNGWRNIYREGYRQREVQINNNKIELQVRDIVGRYQKEIQMLKEKLSESTRKNDEYENNQHLIQQNLKKAFFRGISSMNMEAMSIFSTTNAEEELKSQQMHSAKSNHSYSEHNQMAFSRSVNPLNQTAENLINSNMNSSVMINKQKIESKDHKWKEAPILGMQQKHEFEQPRPILVRPTTEAKVIRIVDGKSNVQTNYPTKQIPKKPSNVTSSKVESSNRKKI